MKVKCSKCDGIGLVAREVPHPYTREHGPVTVTKACPDCGGWGKREQPSLFVAQTVEGTK